MTCFVPFLRFSSSLPSQLSLITVSKILYQRSHKPKHKYFNQNYAYFHFIRRFFVLISSILIFHSLQIVLSMMELNDVSFSCSFTKPSCGHNYYEILAILTFGLFSLKANVYGGLTWNFVEGDANFGICVRKFMTNPP